MQQERVFGMVRQGLARLNLMIQPRLGLQALVVVLSAAGVILVLVTTQRYGAGFDPDSVEYVTCARSLLAGTGYLTHEGEAFTQWPPLFPTLLAGLGALGVDLAQGARWLNALAFGLIVFTSGQLFLLYLRSKALVVLATLSVFSFPMVIISTYVWSEALFVFLSLWFLLRLTNFIERPTWGGWSWLTILGAVACLQRYVGNSLVATGCLIIILCLRGVPLLRRLLWAVLLGVGSLVPVSLWMWRNYLASGLWTGTREPSNTSLWVNLRRTYETAAAWFPPEVAPILIAAVLAALVVVAALVVARCVPGWRGLTLQGGDGDSERSDDISPRKWAGDVELARLAVLVAFVCIYLASLLYAHTTVDLFPIGGRGLAPIYVPVMCIAFVLVDRLVGWTGGLRPAWLAKVSHIVIIALTGFALIVPLQQSYAYTQEALENGVEGYTARETSKTAIMKWLRNNRLEGELYTNEGWKLALVTERIVHWVPPTANDVGAFLAGLSKGAGPQDEHQRIEPGTAKQEQYLVWFDRGRGARWRSGRVLEAFVASGKARLVKEATGGSVYILDR